MRFFAQLDGDDICVAVHQSSEAPIHPNQIEVFDSDPSLFLSRKYNHITATFGPAPVQEVDPLVALKAKPAAVWTLADVAEWLQGKG